MPKSMDRLPLAKKLGRNIARLRYARKLTQEKMAERVDIHDRHYQKIEGGEVCPSFPIINRIRKALKCSWEDLFNGID